MDPGFISGLEVAAPTRSNETRPVEVIERLYRAFDRQDVSAVLDCFSDEIVIRQSDELPWGGIWKGKEGAMAFFTELTSRIRTRVDVERLIVAGDTVVEIGRTEGEAVASGRGFSIAEAHVFRVRAGRVVSMEAYVENVEMLGALEGVEVS
jgi:ketosteroid isomerase-like protein